MARATARLAASVVLAFSTACHEYPVPAPYQVSDTTSGPPATTTLGWSAPASTSGTATDTTASTTEDDDDDVVFLIRTDVPGFECDIFDQDCPRGDKCTIADTPDAGWRSRCVPVPSDPHQAGEPCTSTPTQPEGVDDCDLGLFCLLLAGEIGTCVGFCDAYDDCAPCQACNVSDGFIPVCIPQCDPLNDACPVGTICRYFYQYDFACAVSLAPPGGIGMECSYDDCPERTVCTDGTRVPGCRDDGCCTGVCSPTDPIACLDQPGTLCEPFHRPERSCPSFQDVGRCVLP